MSWILFIITIIIITTYILQWLYIHTTYMSKSIWVATPVCLCHPQQLLFGLTPHSAVQPELCPRPRRYRRPWWDANGAGHGCRWTATVAFLVQNMHRYHQRSSEIIKIQKVPEASCKHPKDFKGCMILTSFDREFWVSCRKLLQCGQWFGTSLTCAKCRHALADSGSAPFTLFDSREKLYITLSAGLLSVTSKKTAAHTNTSWTPHQRKHFQGIQNDANRCCNPVSVLQGLIEVPADGNQSDVISLIAQVPACLRSLLPNWGSLWSIWDWVPSILHV